MKKLDGLHCLKAVITLQQLSVCLSLGKCHCIKVTAKFAKFALSLEELFLFLSQSSLKVSKQGVIRVDCKLINSRGIQLLITLKIYDYYKQKSSLRILIKTCFLLFFKLLFLPFEKRVGYLKFSAFAQTCSISASLTAVTKGHTEGTTIFQS